MWQLAETLESAMSVSETLITLSAGLVLVHAPNNCYVVLLEGHELCESLWLRGVGPFNLSALMTWSGLDK